jgi:hypothetical protein
MLCRNLKALGCSVLSAVRALAGETPELTAGKLNHHLSVERLSSNLAVWKC